MSAPVPDKLHVLVTGVDAAVARDVVRLAAAAGARVSAADADVGKLARLDHDAGLPDAGLGTMALDLASLGAVQLWGAALRAAGRLPQLMICCCGAPVSQAPPTGERRSGGAVDVALSGHRGGDCPALAAEQALRPALFLHAEALRGARFDKTIAVLRHPTLRGVLERAPGGGFSPEAVTRYVRNASPSSAARRPFDAATGAGGRLRLSPTPVVAPERADAA